MALSIWLQYWQGWENNHLARKVVPVFEHSHGKQILPNVSLNFPGTALCCSCMSSYQWPGRRHQLLPLNLSSSGSHGELWGCFSASSFPHQDNKVSLASPHRTHWSSCSDSAELLHPSLHLFPKLLHLRFRTQHISSLIFTSLMIAPVLQSI